MLLVIDDLERVLVADDEGGHRLDDATAPVLAAVLRAFDPRGTDGRVAVTSRFPFRLDGLEAALVPIQVPPLSPSDCQKLLRRQGRGSRRARPERIRTHGASPAARPSRGWRAAARGCRISSGCGWSCSPQCPRERAEQAIEQMEAWLGRGEVPEAAEVRAFLETLALDTLRDLAGASGRALRQALCLFDLPVPVAVAQAVARTLGGSIDQLRDLGLLDAFEDLVDADTDAVAVNRLAATGRGQLDATEARVVAELALPPLIAAWGGASGARPPSADLLLARLGLLRETQPLWRPAPQPRSTCSPRVRVPPNSARRPLPCSTRPASQCPSSPSSPPLLPPSPPERRRRRPTAGAGC